MGRNMTERGTVHQTHIKPICCINTDPGRATEGRQWPKERFLCYRLSTECFSNPSSFNISNFQSLTDSLMPSGKGPNLAQQLPAFDFPAQLTGSISGNTATTCLPSISPAFLKM